MDTSAKTNFNIEKAMLTLVDKILDEESVMDSLEAIKVGATSFDACVQTVYWI